MDYEMHKEEMDRLKYAHEGEVARLERCNKRTFIFALIVFIALILTNAGWIVHESMYEDIAVEQDLSASGNGVYTMNGVGDLNYGSEDAPNNQSTP